MALYVWSSFRVNFYVTGGWNHGSNNITAIGTYSDWHLFGDASYCVSEDTDVLDLDLDGIAAVQRLHSWRRPQGNNIAGKESENLGYQGHNKTRAE